MKYMLDSSVALKWFLSEADSAKANQIREDARKAIHELLVPDFFPTEMTHAITRAERQGRITQAEGAAFVADLLLDLPTLYPEVPLLARAYAISSTTWQRVYDCVYVALAEAEGCELVTADSKLVASLKAQFPFILELANIP